MSNAKRRHRRRWRIVRAAIRAEVFRRWWEANGGIDGYIERQFPPERVAAIDSIFFRESPIMAKLRRDSYTIENP